MQRPVVRRCAIAKMIFAAKMLWILTRFRVHSEKLVVRRVKKKYIYLLRGEEGKSKKMRINEIVNATDAFTFVPYLGAFTRLCLIAIIETKLKSGIFLSAFFASFFFNYFTVCCCCAPTRLVLSFVLWLWLLLLVCTLLFRARVNSIVLHVHTNRMARSSKTHASNAMRRSAFAAKNLAGISITILCGRNKKW